jgi:hypothetical protein
MKQKPCLYYFEGKCHKGKDCSFSHDRTAVSSSTPSYSKSTSTNSTRADSKKSGPVNRKCNDYWEKGECSHGTRCRYRHDDNPALREKGAKPDAEGYTKLVRGGSTQAIDSTFPTYAVVKDSHSDDLLFPTKSSTHGKVKSTLEEYARDGFKIRTVVQAEQLLLALNASHKSNERLVSGQLVQ